MLKIVLIEDEKLTALDLASTLQKIDQEIEIVAILPTVQKSIDFFKSERDFDLIFSDIQLPDGLSFDIFRTVELPTPVIFCTAYDQYALEAFEVNGIDYLLKPFNKASVSKALDKFQTLKSNFSSASQKYHQLIQLLGQQVSAKSTSVIVQKGDKIIPVDLKDIALFYLEDNYVFAFTFDAKKHLLSQTLEEYEKLGGEVFFRANRQFLVNRKAIKDAERYVNRKIIAHLIVPFSQQIIIGKLKTALFMDWLSNH